MSEFSAIDRLNKETAVIAYIDLANVFGWQKVLKWNFRIEHLIKQLLGIPCIKEVRVYFGFDERNPEKSKGLHTRIRKSGGTLITKPVKYIKKAVNADFFIRSSTRQLLDPTHTTLVESLVASVQASGIQIEEKKCNFDVEITLDLMDHSEKLSGVVLFSGDSDFAAPLERLKVKGKSIHIVGVRGLVASELFKIKDNYIDFGKLYKGQKNYLNSENPARGGTA